MIKLQLPVATIKKAICAGLRSRTAFGLQSCKCSKSKKVASHALKNTYRHSNRTALLTKDLTTNNSEPAKKFLQYIVYTRQFLTICLLTVSLYVSIIAYQLQNVALRTTLEVCPSVCLSACLSPLAFLPFAQQIFRQPIPESL